MWPWFALQVVWPHRPNFGCIPFSFKCVKSWNVTFQNPYEFFLGGFGAAAWSKKVANIFHFPPNLDDSAGIFPQISRNESPKAQWKRHFCKARFQQVARGPSLGVTFSLGCLTSSSNSTFHHWFTLGFYDTFEAIFIPWFLFSRLKSNWLVVCCSLIPERRPLLSYWKWKVTW